VQTTSTLGGARFITAELSSDAREVLHINASPAVSFVMIVTKGGGGREEGGGDYVRELRWRRYQHFNNPASRTRRDKGARP